MKQVLYEVNEGIAYITLNRPEKLNTLSNELIAGLHEALDHADFDKEVKVVVLLGMGRVFSAGGDLEMMQAFKDVNEIYSWMNEVTKLTKRVRNLTKHVVAAVHGHAAGAGFSIALAADYIVADENAKFILSFSKVGLVPDMGLYQLLLERLPINIVKEWVSFAPTLSAHELKEKDIINKVTTGPIKQQATDFIKPLIEASPLSLEYSKRILNELKNPALDESILLENMYQTMLLCSIDHQEGIKAFYEKRKPEFIGK
ncbi:enoyl-CoA hydratase [Sporosarcina sp. P3]|uniref:enoyl-CoA hydratase/isomerase family protein n=1 Tax=Sporosarcina sp. P3 TaxID=2048245 RepID=UPI000C17344A|nr:enoyl-CoA hydratase/isomerase family protein [Sporosarcina sp. P3]PID20363.1 enoyl-CoA hydratase [Sporosarcina sp. P3]